MYYLIGHENHIVNHVNFFFCWLPGSSEPNLYLNVINYVKQYGRIFVHFFSHITLLF